MVGVKSPPVMAKTVFCVNSAVIPSIVISKTARFSILPARMFASLYERISSAPETEKPDAW